LSGFGVNALAAIHASFFDHFFIQSELKGGFLNLPSIRTTLSKMDKANQHFFFSQWNILIGAKFRIKK